MSEFFEMGGYAAFVWPAYGLTLAVMAGLLVETLSRLRARRRQLEALEAEKKSRERSAA